MEWAEIGEWVYDHLYTMISHAQPLLVSWKNWWITDSGFRQPWGLQTTLDTCNLLFILIHCTFTFYVYLESVPTIQLIFWSIQSCQFVFNICYLESLGVTCKVPLYFLTFYVCECKCFLYKCAWMSEYIYIYIYIHRPLYVYIYVQHTHIYVHTLHHTHTHTYTYICKHTYTHTHTHIYIYMQTD